MKKILLLVIPALLLPACSGMSEGERKTWGTLGGAAAGAGLGYAVGPKGKKGTSAVIGAVVGGVSGYLLSDAFGESATPEQAAQPKYQNAQAEFQYGAQAQNSGDSEAALRHYAAASDMAPDQPEPYNNAGMIYLGRGDRAMAEQSFRKAIAVSPGYEPARQNLIMMGLQP